MLQKATLLIALLDAYALAAAVPEPTRYAVRHGTKPQDHQAPLAAPDPAITPSPALTYPTRTRMHRRNIIDDVKSDVKSVLTQLGSDIPSYVADGMRPLPISLALC